MKEQIPQEKTRSYWEEKVPNPQEDKRVEFINRRNTFLHLLVITLLIIFGPVIEFGWEEFFSKAVIVGLAFWFSFLFIIMAVSAVSDYLPKRGIKKNFGKDPIVVDELVFYGIKGMWRAHYYEAPEDDPIKDLYPEEMKVARYMIYYKLKGKKRRYGLKQYLSCICSREKYEEIERLIHMKETAILRKESRRFKVTYTKYNKELVKIELAEGETYPLHCDYEELVEKINIMF